MTQAMIYCCDLPFPRTHVCMKVLSIQSVLRLASRRPTRSFIITQSSNRSFSTSHHYWRPQELDDMGKKDEAKGGYQLKVPKGTKDWEGKDMVIRDKIFGTITQVFKRHGAVTIDTSVQPFHKAIEVEHC